MPTGEDDKADEGLRARKRRETAARITEAGLQLFVAKGYDETTLDDIAAEAGISRRTFFYYFKSKDDILLSMQSGLGDALAAAVLDQPASRPPLAAMRDVVLKLAAQYPATPEMVAIDRLMRSSETVRARKQASYVEHEATLFAALRRKWPEPERETSLRLVALLSMGIIRLSLETFGREGGTRSFSDLAREMFDALDGVL